jgi:hypothetical protein
MFSIMNRIGLYGFIIYILQSKKILGTIFIMSYVLFISPYSFYKKINLPISQNNFMTFNNIIVIYDLILILNNNIKLLMTYFGFNSTKLN